MTLPPLPDLPSTSPKVDDQVLILSFVLCISVPDKDWKPPSGLDHTRYCEVTMVYRGHKIVVEACLLQNGHGVIHGTGGLGRLPIAVAEFVQQALGYQEANIRKTYGNGYRQNLDLKTLKLVNVINGEPAQVDILLRAAATSCEGTQSQVECAAMVPAFLLLFQALACGVPPPKGVVVGGGYLKGHDVVLPFGNDENLMEELRMAAPHVKDASIQTLLLPKGQAALSADEVMLDREGNVTQDRRAKAKTVTLLSSFSICDFVVKVLKG